MVDVRILSGSMSIGGNFIRIEDRDKTIIFDQGIRFDLMGKFYSGFITPKGIVELRNIGVLPKPEWYNGVDAIYISHMHLDHLGALSNIPQETKVKIPSMTIYESMEEKWGASSTWLSIIPRKYYVKLEELRPLQTDENSVIAVPVSHSAYPAYAFIYFGADETIAYTGDFRIEGFLDESVFQELNQGVDLFTFLEDNRDIKVDTLIIEGTNIGSDRIPITPKEAMGIIRKLAKDRRQLFATLHPFDIEYAYALALMAEEIGMQIAIVSTSIARLLEIVSDFPSRPKVIEEYLDYPTLFEVMTIENLKEKTLFLVSYREIIDLLRDIELTGGFLEDCLAIISEPEPQNEEGSEYTVIANWFSSIGIELYRIRASGHYYQYQLRTILDKIKPRKDVKIIHTEKHGFFTKILKEIY